MTKKTVMLAVLDGWGINNNKDEKNAIAEVDTKNFDRLMAEYPNTLIKASGEAVGLPEGQMGNSEVGHLNLGAGRVVYQPLVKISKDAREGNFKNIEVLSKLYAGVKARGGALHLGGLLSNGGVHSHIDHVIGLIEMAKECGIEKVYVHAFLDGRDTAPQSALEFIEKLETAMTKIGLGEIVTVAGRYYAMDRDNNWERTEKAYKAIVKGEGAKAATAKEAVENSYAIDKMDEFVAPTVVVEGAELKVGDAFLCFNFRPDRARQITRTIVDKNFEGFEREYIEVDYACMRQYSADIDASVVYEDEALANTYGEVISKAGLTQLRTAETEKYAHVTFFFNGGVEAQYEGEDRALVNSPKVATYDLKPEMSAYEVTEGVIEAIASAKYDTIILNLANPDMVGHTGDFEAVKKAIAVVDECLGKIAEKIEETNNILLVTADHGNAELMEDPETGVAFTAHTINEVPLILVSKELKDAKLKPGKLADLAPTMLDLLGVEKPVEMTGDVLVKR